MKKYVIIPLCICLSVIVLSGYYIYSRYNIQIRAKKELLVSYVSIIKMQLAGIAAHVGELPYIVKPIVGEKGLMNDNLQIYAEPVSMLEDFYDDNSYFIKGISVFDRYGNVFNIYRDKDGVFIKDRYKSRNVNVLRSESEIVDENNSFSYILPVYSGDTLSGNIAVNVDIASLNQTLFEPYTERKDIWTSVILNRDTYLTYPLEDGLVLSREKTIIEETEKEHTGFLFGKISGSEYSGRVLSYYERLPVSGQFLGIVFSYDISSIFFTSLWGFLVICFVLSAMTAAAIIALRRAVRRDLAKHKEKDRQINFMRVMFQNVPVGILVSRQDNLMSANKYAMKLLDGYVSEKDLGESTANITFPSGFHGDSEQDEFREWALCHYERNGKEIYLGKKQTNVEEDNTKYVIDAFCDITEMEQSRKNAIRSEIAKSELLSRIGNDFRKPLGDIKDALVLLEQKYPDEPNAVHIDEAAESLSDMIDNIQDFADIEAGRAIPDETPFNLADELKKVADMYMAETQQKGIGLHAHIASSADRRVVGDPQRFRQVLDQLLSNAVKFTKEGEVRVSLEATDMQDGKVLVKCSIEDTGEGMSKKKLKNLFSIDLRAKEEGESIGLGIIVAKKLVTIMGGTIRVTSPSPIATCPETPGVQFFFTIQCYSDPPLNKKIDFSSIVSYDQINVLIISSDPHQVQYLVNFLNRKGIRTDIFVYNKDSAELLTNKLIIDKDRYQIVIIETADSGTSFAVAEKIHQTNLTEQCLYVVVDSYRKKSNYLKARSLCVDYYFIKSEDLSGFDPILKTNFVNLSEKKRPSVDALRKDLRILVAENNSLSQSVAKIVFNRWGYEIDFAQNALDLISQMNRTSYDIIFIDLKFPPSNGFEIAEMLRQKGYKMPIIAMTSTHTKENLKKVSESGMNGYVSKPLNPEKIKNILFKWFV